MSGINSKKQLDKETWMLIMTNALFAVASALSSSFVSVYLWKINKGFTMIAWFYFFSYLGTLLATLFTGWMIKRVDRVIGIRFGVGILSLFYLLVLFLQMNSTPYVLALGSLLGIGNGFFWLSFFVLYFEITHRENRDKCNGINGLSVAFAGMISPLISGFVITKIDHGFRGYRIIFTISLLIFLAAVVLSFFFRSRSSKKDYRIRHVLSQLTQTDQKWFWISISMLVQGIREGGLFFLLSLLIYVFTTNEMTLSWFLAISSFVALIANILISRYIDFKHRLLSLLWGTSMLGIAVLPFILKQNIATILLFGVGVAFFYPFYYGPLTSTIFDVVGEKNEHVELRVEYIVAKDIILNVGRILSVLLFIWWIHDTEKIEHMRWYLLVVGLVQTLITFFMYKMEHLKEEE